MAAEPFAPFVSLAGVFILIGGIAWMISPGFRSLVRYKMMRALLVLAILVVALGLLSYDWN